MLKVKHHIILNFKYQRLVVLVLLCLIYVSCRNNSAGNLDKQNFTASLSNPSIAAGFDINESDDLILIEIFHPRSSKKVEQQFLLSTGKINADEFAGYEKIIAPFNRVVCLSATHISYLDALGETNKIVGLGSAGFVASDDLKLRIEQGEVADVGAGEHLKLESLLQLQPDAVFVSLQPGQSYEMLQNAGITVIAVGDYLENHPLGRAEWIKFFGEFFEKREQARMLFDSIKNEYNQLKDLTALVLDRPVVLSGKQYGGFWNLPGGKSYVAQFLYDAGALYLWNDNNETAGLSLDFEAVFMKGISADYWRFLVYSNQPYNYGMLLAEDNRYEEFEAFRKKQVIVCNTFEKPYFQKGVLEPQIMLADLISIFHPELLPEHENIYYQLLK